MPTLKQAAVIALFASVSNNEVGGGFASAVPLKQPARHSLPADEALLQTEQRVATRQKQSASLNAQTAAKWGFLKNIVNIDRFFASGPEPAESGLHQKAKSIVPQSLAAKNARPGKKMTKLSQLHPKVLDIASGISDDTATAAAEQALTEAANTMTDAHHDELPAAAEQPIAEDTSAAQTADESTDKQVEEAAAALAAARQALAEEVKGKSVSPEVQKEIDAAQEALAAEFAKLQVAKPAKKASTEAAPVAAPEASKEEKGEEISDLPTKAAKEAHAASVREEGLNQIAQYDTSNKEIDLEIEAPGAATEVAEEGASILTSQDEFHRLEKELLAYRQKPENKVGKGGFQVNFRNPQ
jgi:hypothetical protein